MLKHSWNFTNPRVNCSVHGAHPWDWQYKDSSRLTTVWVGGIPFNRQHTEPGDTDVAGSGSWVRCDGLNTDPSVMIYADKNKAVEVWAPTFYLPSNDFHPTGGVDDVLWTWHKNRNIGWPATAGSATLRWRGNTNDGQALSWYPWQTPNMSGGNPGYPVATGLWIEQTGGRIPTGSTEEWHAFNWEYWPFLPAAAVLDKVLQIATKIKWSANETEVGDQRYMEWNGDKPTNYADSGYVEIVYRLGTPSGGQSGSIAWGPWTWYDPGVYHFANNGLSQTWVNGSQPYRHYRPTADWYDDSDTFNGCYPKLNNYHTPLSSSTYTGFFRIGDSYTDVGAPEVGSNGGGEPPVEPPAPPNPADTLLLGKSTIGVQRGGSSADYKRGVVYTMPEDGEIRYAYEFISNGSASPVPRRFVIYAVDVNDAPTTRLAVVNASIPASMTEQWVEYQLSTPLQVEGGTRILIGVQNSPPTDAISCAFDIGATGIEWFRLDTYADGASDPWSASEGGGITGRYDNQHSLCVAYAPVNIVGAPNLTDASAFLDQLTMTFDEALDTSSVPSTSAFLIDGLRGTSMAPQEVEISGSTVTLTLPVDSLEEEALTVSYTPPASNMLRAAGAGVAVTTIVAHAVTNTTVFPAYPILDNFDRADGDPGTNWILAEGAGRGVISGNRYYNNTSGFLVILYDADFQADQEAYFTHGGADTYFQLRCRWRTSDKSGYYFEYETDTQNLNLYRAPVGGIQDQLASVHLTTAPSAGDVFGIRARGNTITVYRNGVAIANVTDSTYSRIGKIGFGVGVTQYVDDFGGPVVQTGDTAPPVFVSASVNGTALALTFTEALDSGYLPAGSAWTVKVNNVTVAAPTPLSIFGTTVSLRLQDAVEFGDTVTIAYTQPASNRLRDLAGNPAASFTAQTVTNTTRSLYPAYSVADTFDRADGDPGANWTLVEGPGRPTINANQMLNNQVSTVRMVYNTLYGERQEAFFTVLGNYDYDVLLRYDEATNTGYVLRYIASTHTMTIYRREGASTWVSLGSATITALAAGDVIGFDASQTMLTAFVNSRAVLAVNDSTYVRSGKTGFGMA
jgi:uncharacterized repeat protein (TIGR02059 family)